MTDPAEREVSLSTTSAVPVEYETFDHGSELQRALSSRQVAHWLRISEAEIVRLAEEGALPGRHVGGVWRFGAIALNRWIERAELEPAPLPNPVLEEFSAIARQWTQLETLLTKALEPIVGTSVEIANDGGVAFSGSFVTMAQLERSYMLHVLAQQDGNRTHAARVLGIDPSTLYRKLGDL